jgi:hypothetical protein
MSGQVGTLSESFVAPFNRADVGPFSGVGPKMGPKVEVQREPFMADVTLIGLLSCMHKLVPFEFRII